MPTWVVDNIENKNQIARYAYGDNLDDYKDGEDETFSVIVFDQDNGCVYIEGEGDKYFVNVILLV